MTISFLSTDMNVPPGPFEWPSVKEAAHRGLQGIATTALNRHPTCRPHKKYVVLKVCYLTPYITPRRQWNCCRFYTTSWVATCLQSACLALYHISVKTPRCQRAVQYNGQEVWAICMPYVISSNEMTNDQVTLQLHYNATTPAGPGT